MANVFPKWTNWLPMQIGALVTLIGGTAIAGWYYYVDPEYMRVGYQPEQPVWFSHDIHSGQLGIDCRYCHSHVDKASHSNVPSTQVCMSCHTYVQTASERLEPIRASWESGKPIEWVRIHQAPDYAYFNHAVHVNRGVSCVDCHGRVDQMDQVYHAESHSMGWCLECHRNPQNYLRPLDEVYNLDWDVRKDIEVDDDDKTAEVDGQMVTFASDQATQKEVGNLLREAWNVNPPETCAACHR